MCNLYSVTKGQQAIREAFGAMVDRAGNLPSMEAFDLPLTFCWAPPRVEPMRIFTVYLPIAPEADPAHKGV